MIITFQVQIDPIKKDLTPKKRFFSDRNLQYMLESLQYFMSELDGYGEYVRGEMYVDGRVYNG